MKELTKTFQDSEVEIVAEKQQQKVIKLIDRQRKIRGHILWEYNQETHDLIPAKFKKQDFQITSTGNIGTFAFYLNQSSGE